jgi:hypothetical protein
MIEDSIREKLLCFLRNEIHNFKTEHIGILYFDLDNIDIRIQRYSVYKREVEEIEQVVEPKYFWQKIKTEKVKTSNKVFAYYKADVYLFGYKYELAKEEYEELIKLRDNRLKKELIDKLCKNQNNKHMTKNQILWEIYQKEDCSQTEFAKKVGMNRTTNISLWLSDQKDISFEKLEDIANRLNYKLNVSYTK